MYEKNRTTDYCVAYRCNKKKGWEVGFHGCICPDETIFNEMVDQVRNSKLLNSKQFQNETLCCKSTLFTQTTEENAEIQLTCPMDNTPNKEESKDLKCAKNQWASYEIKVRKFQKQFLSSSILPKNK